jgi:hypothetical protein
MFFNHPDLRDGLTAVFRQYTANRITLGEASCRVREMLPRPISLDEMDAYLDASFATYPGLPEWIEWCLSRDILFMINTTGMVGYFQRVFAKGLLPGIPALSAHPMIRYDPLPSDPERILDLFEIQDKPRNTELILRSLGLAVPKVILMGDSGGDGPHFEWGAKAGALLVGSMTKPSLKAYCEGRRIAIHVAFNGVQEGELSDAAYRLEGKSFMELAPVVEDFLAR